jgi:DHA2 family multidrug resistance protein-like MFS transporter
MTSEVTGAAPPRSGRAAWVGLAVLALPTFVVAIDLFVLLLALPRLAADLGADSVQQLWVSDIYGFLLAGFLISMGTLGDRIGRRRLLMIGGAVFAAASVLTAYAPTPELLIVARGGLGVAGATLMPSTIALIGGLFGDPKQRATAYGIWGGAFTMGAVFGPVLGGVLLEYFWWGSVFLIAVPFLVLMLVLAPRYLPEFSNPNAGRLDYASVGLSVVALLAVIYGIKELARHGWQAGPGAALAIGLVLGVLFVRRQHRLVEPLLDLSLFSNRVITATLVNQLAFSAVGAGLLLLMLLYFQLVDGMSTLNAALAVVPGMLVAAAGMQLAPKLGARFRPAHVIGGGMFLAALVYVGLTQVSVGNGTWMLIVGFSGLLVRCPHGHLGHWTGSQQRAPGEDGLGRFGGSIEQRIRWHTRPGDPGHGGRGRVPRHRHRSPGRAGRPSRRRRRQPRRGCHDRTVATHRPGTGLDGLRGGRLCQRCTGSRSHWRGAVHLHRPPNRVAAQEHPSTRSATG